jgi:PleD family two-component response regulator
VSPEASVGVVQWSAGETPEKLIGRADAALKTAKRKAYSGDAEDAA